LTNSMDPTVKWLCVELDAKQYEKLRV